MGWSVYKHTFPNKKVYIGITKRSPKKRWANGFGYRSQLVFGAIVKFGWCNIKHEILCSNLTEYQAKAKERELICLYDSCNILHGYNISDAAKKDCGTTPKRKIVQIDIESGKEVQAFNNLNEANEKTEIPIAYISAVCRGMRELAGGFYWKYERR